MKTLCGFFTERSQVAECDLFDQLHFDPPPGEWDDCALVNLVDAFCHSLIIDSKTYLYVRVMNKIAIDVVSDKNSKTSKQHVIMESILQIPALFNEDAMPKRFLLLI